jgi:ferredoxin
MLKVRIDSERCQGHGRCYSLAPAVFESDDEGYGRVVSEEIPEELRSKAELGEASCPERAIFLES